jgi:hypothetical protein
MGKIKTENSDSWWPLQFERGLMPGVSSNEWSIAVVRRGLPRGKRVFVYDFTGEHCDPQGYVIGLTLTEATHDADVRVEDNDLLVLRCELIEYVRKHFPNG